MADGGWWLASRTAIVIEDNQVWRMRFCMRAGQAGLQMMGIWATMPWPIPHDQLVLRPIPPQSVPVSRTFHPWRDKAKAA